MPIVVHRGRKSRGGEQGAEGLLQVGLEVRHGLNAHGDAHHFCSFAFNSPAG